MYLVHVVIQWRCWQNLLYRARSRELTTLACSIHVWPKDTLNIRLTLLEIGDQLRLGERRGASRQKHDAGN